MSTKNIQKTHTAEFKIEALKLADKIGVAATATYFAKNHKWVGDIMYLMTSEGWLYLCVIIDLYSRAVIGWSMSNRMTAELCVMR
jgi:transposase InsO family protein